MPNELLGQLQDAAAASTAIETLRAAKKAAQAKATTLLTSVGARLMTEAEQTEFNGYLAEANGLQATLNAHTALGNIPADTLATAMVTAQTTSAGVGAGPGAGPGVAGLGRPTITGPNATTGHTDTSTARVYENHLDEPWGYRLLGDACLAPANESKEARRARVSTCFGDYLQTGYNGAQASARAQAPDIRLTTASADFMRRASIAPAGSSEMVPSDGGFLVSPDFVDTLLQLIHETGVVYPMVRHIPLSTYTNSIKIPAVDEQSRKDGYRNGGVQAFWENEAQQLTGSKPTFNQIELVTKKLTGLYYATQEILSDARVLGDFAMQAFGEEFGFKLDDGIIEGTGAGQLSGILGAKCVVQIAKEQNQAAATVNFPNVLNMWGQMYARGRRTSVWLINQTVEKQLNQLSQVVGTGGVPVFLPNGTGLFGAAVAQLNASVDEIAGMSGVLFGRPVYVIEQASVLGTVGDIILFDPTQYLMIDKGPIQAASSMHVRFLTDEWTYRWILRCDGQIWWKTSLQSFKGTTTYSPIVTLATRS